MKLNIPPIFAAILQILAAITFLWLPAWLAALSFHHLSLIAIQWLSVIALTAAAGFAIVDAARDIKGLYGPTH